MKVGKLHHKTRDLTGLRFGMLVALDIAHRGTGKVYWNYRCDCGNVCVKNGSDVTKEMKKGRIGNCGCKTREFISQKHKVHGMTYTPIWTSWCNMRARCTNPAHESYKNYGGRGITVCKQWALSFVAFYKDMGDTYRLGLELERTDNNKGYSKTNCRWATTQEQSMNRRTTIRRVDVPALAAATGISRSTIYYRLKNGWPADKLAIPPNLGNRYSTLLTVARKIDS